jgi:hypothetical protein
MLLSCFRLIAGRSPTQGEAIHGNVASIPAWSDGGIYAKLGLFGGHVAPHSGTTVLISPQAERPDSKRACCHRAAEVGSPC